MEIISIVISSKFAQTILLTLFTALVAQMALARGKLRWSLRHHHWYKLPGAAANNSDINIVTQDLWFHNIGRAAVEDIEIVFNWKPEHYEIWNPREHNNLTLPDGRFIVKIPTLTAKEFFSISLLDTKELPRVVNVRSKNSGAKEIPMIPMRLFPMWFNLGAMGMMFVGLGATIYFVLGLVNPLLSGVTSAP
jgi:hypothetical protein